MISLDQLADLAAIAYVVIFVMAALDVMIPILPSETVVVLGGVLAWQGRLHLGAVLVVAAAGAILGDHLSYGIGRRTERLSRAERRTATGKIGRLQAWASHKLDTHGPVVLIVARFIPGGRTASTFVSGRLSYPLARFTPVTVLAGFLWAGFGSALGYLGGTTFHENTLLATALGVAVGAAVAALVELVMSRLGHKPAAEEPPADDSGDLAA
jgi:membrane protein DedA with SNARE-associated domain